MKLILSIAYLVFTSLGVLFMKLGGDSLSLALKDGIVFKMGFLTLLGFVFYLCSFLLWQRLLVNYNLTYIVPILTGISQIVVIIMGCLFFKESLNLYNVMGIILVIVGVVLIGIKIK